MTGGVPNSQPKSAIRAAAGGNGAASIPKPYTEYTIFFRLERARLLQATGIIDEETVASLDPTHADPLEFPRPPGYEQITMPPYWYSSSHKAVVEKRRKHRKRAGRMDLKTMSKTISASWRNAPGEVVQYCRRLAREELERYNRLVERSLDGGESSGEVANGAPKEPNKGQLQRRATFHGVPDGTLSMKDLAAQDEPQQPGAGTGTTCVPVPNDLDMGSVQGQGATNEALVMLQLQQHLRGAMHAARTAGFCPGISPDSVNATLHPSSDPFASLPSTSGFAPGAPQMNATEADVQVPEKKRKAFVRRASAPPEFTGMNTEVRPYLGPMNCIPTMMDDSIRSRDSPAPHNDNVDKNVFLCEDASPAQPPSKMNFGQRVRRRASMTDMSAGHAAELRALRTQHGSGAHRASLSSAEDGGIASSFIDELRQEFARGDSTIDHGPSAGFPQQELRQEFARGSEFSCVPSNWGSEDASTLLDLLGGETAAAEPFPPAASPERAGSVSDLDLSPPSLDRDTSVGRGMLALLREGTAEPEAGPVTVGNVMFG